MQAASSNLQDYLEATAVIDWQHPDILQTTRELVDGTTDEVETVRRLFEWVRDRIPHAADIGSQVVTCTASEVLRQGTGICYAKSHLLAAMLRSQQIPAGFCYQVLRRDAPQAGMVLHGLNGVWIPSLARWFRLDPRGNVRGIDAQFSLAVERLAFPVQAEWGEFIYEDILAAPASVVLDVLQRFSRRTDMWPHLPVALPVLQEST